jgi:hypothetical protein
MDLQATAMGAFDDAACDDGDATGAVRDRAAQAGERSGTPRTSRLTSEGPIDVARRGPASSRRRLSRLVEKAAAHTRSQASASDTARRKGAIASSAFTSTLKCTCGQRSSASARVIGGWPSTITAERTWTSGIADRAPVVSVVRSIVASWKTTA